MATLIATKSFYLSGRGDVHAGQSFEIADRHARTLKAIGKAKDPPHERDLMPPRRYRTRAEPQPEVRTPEAPEAPEEHQEEPLVPRHNEPVDERAQIMAALRTRAAAMGIEVDGRWGEERLRGEINAARARYERRDMQAKE
jgi:hypothetical protein